MDYERAPSADRAARAAAVRAATAALRDFAAGNPALPVLADNPFGVQADIAAVLTDAAERIDALVAA